MTPRIWSLPEVMKLVSTNKLGIYLSDLHDHRSECFHRRQITQAHRDGLFVKGVGKLDREDGPEAQPNDATVNQVLKCLQHLQELAHELGWEPSRVKASLSHTRIEYNREDNDWSSLEAELSNALDMILSDLWQAKFAHISIQYADYVNNPGLIADHFSESFPSAVEDIKEAGNCIAVDLGTAAVFHLMRGVEWGMRAFCVDLGLLTTRHKNLDVPIEFSQWNTILDHVFPKIEEKVLTFPAGRDRQEAQEFYHGLYLDIKGFKDAFRNHVSHTRKAYSQKAADDVLDYVRRFFVLLGTKISEKP